jgi:ABC-type glycerol-3-phosphate transport system substrate-binding protein
VVRAALGAILRPRLAPPAHDYSAASGDLRHDQIYNERVWAKAIRRIVTENIAPAQALDEAIARIKQILAQ